MSIRIKRIRNVGTLFRWWSRIYRRSIQLFDNRMIRSKVVYVYILCVLVPVLATNTVIIASMLRSARLEQKEIAKRIADSVEHSIVSALDSAVYITIDLFTNKSVYKFLDKQYTRSTDYYSEYSSISQSYMFSGTTKELIRNMTLFSDNSTMINGGKYFRINEVRDMDWYKELHKQDSDLFIYSNYNDTYYANHFRRQINVIRNLNFMGTRHNEKIVSIEMNYNAIEEVFKNSALESTVYICEGSKVLFSNDRRDRGEMQDFLNISCINRSDMQLHKRIHVYGKQWDVYITDCKLDYLSQLRDNFWLIGLLFLTDALIPALALNIFSSSISNRILLLGSYLRKTKGDSFELIDIRQGKDEIGELLENYNRMILRMQNLIESEYKSRLEQQELSLARQQAELLALYSQINPHFLFNVLENIRMRSILKGEEETSLMIESLAKLMRKSAQWGNDYITLEQEIGFIEDYLQLQKYRFEDRFRYKIRMNEEYFTYRIPSLVLVTFVENSCVHGLNRAGNYGSIFITAYEENKFFYIEIEDSGIGMEKDQVAYLEHLLNQAGIDELQNANSLGMLNAGIRLRKYYGERTRILVESEPMVGTCIIIEIPMEYMKSNDSKKNVLEDGKECSY